MPRAPRGSSSSGADVQKLIDAAREGNFGPVQVLVGTERFLVERAITYLKRASLGDGPAGFNDDLFHGAAGLSGPCRRP